jgi:hypothetical protein
VAEVRGESAPLEKGKTAEVDTSVFLRKGISNRRNSMKSKKARV